jgi:2,4-dienoyl-CoA reductase-like NADH-dependent reductase (Old Yellow Enzyme family)/thioredoxin reductase
LVAESFEHCFDPLDIGDLHLRNRLMMTTHGPRLSQSRYLRYLAERSRDVALVGLHAGYGMGGFPPGPGQFRPEEALEVGAVAPHPLSREGRAWCERHVPVLREQAEGVQRNGARCVGQLHHAGAADGAESLGTVVGPSAVPDEFRRRMPHALTAEEIADLVQVFAEAADRVFRAGCDAVEIHAAHGYLLNQFLSPLTNIRGDRYGGSAENRIRLLLEVVDAVRVAIDGAIPVGVRIPGSEAAEGGLTNADMAEIGRRLAAAGSAYLNVSNGTSTGLRLGLGLAYVAPAYVAPGPSVADAAAIRIGAGLPVVVAGRIVDPTVAERLLADGQVDMVGFTRALIADPRIFAKARRGSSHTINRCIACNECHTGLPVRCTVNPAAGREDELTMRRARSERRVVVVGGGPAGMLCASMTAGRGHRVTLLEQSAALGGTLAVLGRDPHRPELAGFGRHLQNEVARADIDVHLGVTVTSELVADLSPDEVVMAVGAEELVPALPGADLIHVITALAVLRGDPMNQGHVAVIGGLEDHLPPLVVADLLARAGRRVTIVSEQVAIGEAVEAATRFELLRRLHARGVEFQPLSALMAITPESVVVRDVLTNHQSEIDGIDAVVLACGRRSRIALAEELALHRGSPSFDVRAIGDCLAPRRLLHATMDAARLAVTL